MAIVMNAGSKGVSEYTDYPFIAFTVINGVVVGVAQDGIYTLDDSTTDNTTSIDATVEYPPLDFGSKQLKRISSVMMNGEVNGEVQMLARVDGGVSTPAKTLEYFRGESNQNRRVKFGKGTRSRHWGFVLSTVDGSAFDMNDLVAEVAELGRRV